LRENTLIDVSIIIVSWNVADLLAACLDTILASPIAINEADGEKSLVEIIVLDSASSDKTVSMLQAKYPQVHLLAQDENVGFTRGNNIGLKAAQGRYHFLLNPDTEIIADAIPQMVKYLDENPKVGIVGPHTVNPDGSYQSSRRHFPSKTLAFFESTWLESFAPQTMLDDFYVRNAPEDAVLEVDWMQGSALMARREVYEQIGGLDEGYVMYSEEMDWQKRAKDAAWQVVFLGTAKVIHHGGKSTEQIGAQKHIWFQESKLRYFRKHHGKTFATILRGFLLLNYLWQIALETSKSAIGHKREMRQERVRTYWQVLRSGLKDS
jgi:GT2 family glycosyltransferase